MGFYPIVDEQNKVDTYLWTKKDAQDTEGASSCSMHQGHLWVVGLQFSCSAFYTVWNFYQQHIFYGLWAYYIHIYILVLVSTKWGTKVNFFKEQKYLSLQSHLISLVTGYQASCKILWPLKPFEIVPACNKLEIKSLMTVSSMDSAFLEVTLMVSPACLSGCNSSFVSILKYVSRFSTFQRAAVLKALEI